MDARWQWSAYTRPWFPVSGSDLRWLASIRPLNRRALHGLDQVKAVAGGPVFAACADAWSPASQSDISILVHVWRFDEGMFQTVADADTGRDVETSQAVHGHRAAAKQTIASLNTSAAGHATTLSSASPLLVPLPE